MLTSDFEICAEIFRYAYLSTHTPSKAVSNEAEGKEELVESIAEAESQPESEQDVVKEEPSLADVIATEEDVQQLTQPEPSIEEPQAEPESVAQPEVRSTPFL